MNPQLEELASLYVLDQLDAPERAAFERRLPLDAELAALVRDLESALARRIRALPQQTPPADLLGRIEQRIDRLPDQENFRSTRPVHSRWPTIARWGLAAVIALGLATLAVQSLRRAPASPLIVFVGLDSQRSTFAELSLQERAKGADARFIQLASLAEKFWRNPNAVPVRPTVASGSDRGYALFDPGSNQGFIAIEQLPAIAQGQHYHLWIVDTASAQVRDAGTLPLTAAQHGLYSFFVGPASAVKPDRVNFFVTAEDDAPPHSPEPHGKIVLGDRRI